ncbi:MAG: response regulator [bacterium]
MLPRPENPPQSRPASDDHLEVALLVPFGRDASLICDLLERAGLSCRTVNDFGELHRLIADFCQLGAVLVAEEALGPLEADALAVALDNEPPWSDLPLVLLAHADSSSPQLERLLHRPSAHTLRRPLQPSTMLATISSAIEIRRRQYQVRDLLDEARSMNEELRRRASQLRRLSLRLTDAEEQERRRLAIYVHDDLQQILAGVKFHLDVTERRLADPEELRAALGRIRGLVADAIEGTRSLAHQLSPAALRRNGLVAALNWLVDNVKQVNGLDVTLHVDIRQEPDEQSIVVFLFRAAQELLLNVVKHAGTLRAEISLVGDRSGVRLDVKDYGTGFEPPTAVEVESDESFGLYSIRERAELLGGTMEMESAPGEGTLVSVRVPGGRRVEELATLGAESLADDSAGVDEDVPSAHPRRIRVALVDDHVVMRSGLRLVLAEHDEIEILDEYDDGSQAVEAADTVHPDLFLMDVAMPIMDGIEATREIKRRHPEIRVIALSMFDDPETSRKMIDAGAERYLSKAGPSEDLISAILRPA